MVKNVSQTLKIISWILVILFVLLDFYGNLGERGLSQESYSIGQAMGASIWVLIGGLIAIACGNKSTKWAQEINKSPNIAYAIGFLFSLLGLFGYWIYYSNKPKKKAEIKEEKIEDKEEGDFVYRWFKKRKKK